MKYNILDRDDNIINTIVSDEEFVKSNFEFYKLVVEENTIASIQVPQTITPLQAKLQLLSMGLLDEVDEMVATDRKVQLYWEYALTIERNNEILLLMAEQLKLTSEDLDDMFIEASKL